MVPNQMRYQTALRSDEPETRPCKAFAAAGSQSQSVEPSTKSELRTIRRQDHRNITGGCCSSVLDLSRYPIHAHIMRFGIGSALYAGGAA